MEPFEFDDVPPLAMAVETRTRRWVWVIAGSAGLLGLLLIVSYFIVREPVPAPKAAVLEVPATPVAHRCTSGSARTAETIATRTDPVAPKTAEPATTVDALPSRREPPWLRKLKLSPEQQARWDRARKILAAPEQLVLYSLYPYQREDEHPRESFHGWKIHGKISGHYAAARTAVDELVGAIRPGMGAKCFEPRHGVRATAGGETVDLVICFACHWVYVYLGTDDDADLVMLVVTKHDDALEKLLNDAGVHRPLALREWD